MIRMFSIFNHKVSWDKFAILESTTQPKHLQTQFGQLPLFILWQIEFENFFGSFQLV
jgi:hypothetical protein